MKRLCSVLAVLVGALFAVLPPVLGQSTEPRSSGSDRTDVQLRAIERADEVAGRLRSMPWGPEVVDALARLGTTACDHDLDLGVRVFETAYLVATGIELEPNEESSLETLSSLASAAARCHPDFSDRALTRDGSESTLSALESLNAALATMGSNPEEAAIFAEGVASQFHTLPAYRQLAFIEVLWKLREEHPPGADALFRAALLGVASSGTIESLSALGNYLFGPDGPDSAMQGGVGVAFVADRRTYVLRFLRSAMPVSLAHSYIGAVTDILLARGTPIGPDAESFALATQLGAWARTNAPEHAAALDGLLNAQPDSIGGSGHQSGLREQILSTWGRESPSLEEQMESAPDHRTKSMLGFWLCARRINAGQLDLAEELLHDMEPDLRGQLSDIISLKRATAAIASDSLVEATGQVAALNDGLHQVLASLSLAKAHWTRSQNSERGSADDVDSADRALQIAIGAVEGITDRLRPHARMKIAAVLAKFGGGERALYELELAVQELNAARSQEPIEESLLSVEYREGGGVSAVITYSDHIRYFSLLPPILRGDDVDEAMYRLALSPEMDLNRLGAIATQSGATGLRARGLVAVASGGLARAFGSTRE